jgi:predicted component of viral defense system (DUF524 family)
MNSAFTYRARREGSRFERAEIGSLISLDERVEYILSFPGGCAPAIARRFADLGGDLLQSETGILSFGNFVGRTELAGVVIEVISTKIGAGGVSRVLQEISELGSSLVFGWGSPTGFAATADATHHAPVPYHQLQFLRRVMLGEASGRRLQDWLGAVERSPTRRFEPERPVVGLERTRRLDNRAVQSIFTRLERLVPVPAGAPVEGSRLAQALTFGEPVEPHFPAKVAAPRGRLSFDTPENRFVKHVIGECLALVYRFVDHPKLHQRLLGDCRIMLGILEQAASSPFLAEAGRLSGFQSPSQALVKADGYREVFSFWVDLTRHVSLPRSAIETSRLLEGRDIATLYEYWVFLKVIEACVEVTGCRPLDRPELRRDEMGESLAVGLSMGVGPHLTVRFNPTFRRSSGTAYSTPLRPDVIVEVDGTCHAFDAKYRLDRFDAGEGDADDDPATYKRADLYKMHTYRDAISALRTAFVVYPGSEFVFFDRSSVKHTVPDSVTIADGVGAVPLRPANADPGSALRGLLRVLLIRRV